MGEAQAASGAAFAFVFETGDGLSPFFGQIAVFDELDGGYARILPGGIEALAVFVRRGYV